MSPLTGDSFAPCEGPEPVALHDLEKYERLVEEQVDRFISRLSEKDLDRTFLVPTLSPGGMRTSRSPFEAPSCM
jgi:hypothetical protein